MTPLLLSKRQAAKLLGIGRDTLTALIKEGHVRTVSVLGPVRIPLAELERFAREGTGPAPQPRKRTGDDIRAINVA